MDPVAAIRRPEYTGENRCIPCTVTNVVIAVAVAAALAAVSVPVAAGVFALSLVSIYLRGYLVPGTPTLTKRYFPDWLLRFFDKDPATMRGSADPSLADEEAFDPEAILLETGALEECEDVEDLCLSDSFAEAWEEGMARLDDDDTTRRDLAQMLDIDAEGLEFEEHGHAFVAMIDGRRIGQWESRPAFLADMAAARELRERYPSWTSFDIQRRSQLLSGLRLFIEDCPTCGGPVTLKEDTVESCCREIDVIAATCEDCGARLFEIQSEGIPVE